MARYAHFFLALVFIAGCSQTVRTTRVGDAYEVEVHDDGTTAMLNSSILHHDWDEAAKKVCPAGMRSFARSITRKSLSIRHGLWGPLPANDESYLSL